jgi:hypothetical protein
MRNAGGGRGVRRGDGDGSLGDEMGVVGRLLVILNYEGTKDVGRDVGVAPRVWREQSSLKLATTREQLVDPSQAKGTRNKLRFIDQLNS